LIFRCYFMFSLQLNGWFGTLFNKSKGAVCTILGERPAPALPASN
jgi:hypothetical protein